MISIGNLQINKLYLGDVEVTKAYLGDVEVYSSTPPVPEGKYMTITTDDAAGETVIKPTWNGTSSSKPNLQYRINNGKWTDFIGTTADIHLTAGKFVQFRGNNQNGISTYLDYLNFGISGNPVSLSGNVMSIIDGVGDSTVIPSSYCFYKLFSKSNVKTVSSDFLPATTLKNYCYSWMFWDCTSLTQAPELPNTTLAYGCYDSMFVGCTSLTTAPVLPATTLTEDCYRQMFQGCTALATAPALPATTLADYCYASMFEDCTSFTTAPALPATILDTWCYYSMFSGCTSLTTAPELPATTLAESCYQAMFADCKSLVNAPELPATTLASSCYTDMFRYCTSLKTAPELPATTLAESCYYQMFTSCRELNYVKSLAKNISAKNALRNWLNGVASSGTFVKPAGVKYPISTSGIPSGWKVIEERPKPEGKYITMTVLDGASGTTIAPTIKGSLPNLNLQYRVNSNGDWTNFIVGTTADIHLVSGDWIQFKGNNTSGLSTGLNDYLKFNISGNTVALSGNIMSLIDGVGNTLVIPSEYCFNYLFSGSSVKSVTSDFLPATTLKNSCYYNMFSGCKSLVNAPALPATSLEPHCYYGMFSGCTSLTQAPEIIPASSVGRYSCGTMFSGCTSLTQAPALPATSIDEDCYSSMFYNCTSLTKAPELPATTLKDYCYSGMFSMCTSLNYVKCYARYFATKSLNNWLYKVASSGTFVKPSGVSYKTGTSGIPSGWTIQNI